MARGHIRRSKSGKRWEAYIYLGLRPDGTRHYEFISSRNREDVENEVARLLARRADGRTSTERKRTVAEWLMEWLDDRRDSVSPRTYESYESTVMHHLIPKLGDIRLDQLRAPDIASYLRSRRREGRKDGKTTAPKGLSVTTIRYHYRILRAALQQAADWGLVAINQATLVTPPDPVKYRPTVYDVKQIAVLLAGADDDESVPGLHRIIRHAVLTGARQGEIVGLRWSKLDLDTGRKLIDSTIQTRKVGAPLVGPPKSESGFRLMTLSAAAIDNLRAHRREQAAYRLQRGAEYENNDLVFADPEGKPLVGSVVTKRFQALLERLGLPKIRFHDLRHSHASLMLSAGVTLGVASKRMGHSGIGITNDLYSHLLPETDRAAADAVDRVIFGLPEPDEQREA